ncbi:enoyl-ACP reductase FabI [uncultured Tessaracoccus sp.]|uniref:enoyl-ACP reductase FabI n=1 Tax=uncultured Tessaracoccus sp. TaxID=905023 RepID=UPI0025D2992E|nr:enoyl-ACP reductase FabI [uncultured Tessaracoccus sp.]
MGILDGKTILVTGVTLDTSIAYAVADVARQEGANVVISAAGRALRLATRVAKRLDPDIPVLELDVTEPEHLDGLPDALAPHVGDRLDGIVHSIAFAHPERALGGAFLDTDWDDVATAVQVSAYSLKSLAMAARPLMGQGSSIVGLTFDARVSWPAYDWMGVAKAALESTSRYLARYLGPAGIRSNLVAAGPIDTVAKQAIPGADAFNAVWGERAPLGWDPKDAQPAARAVVALLSDWFPATTGEMLHVDGGLHSTGA